LRLFRPIIFCCSVLIQNAIYDLKNIARIKFENCPERGSIRRKVFQMPLVFTRDQIRSYLYDQGYAVNEIQLEAFIHDLKRVVKHEDRKRRRQRLGHELDDTRLDTTATTTASSTDEAEYYLFEDLEEEEEDEDEGVHSSAESPAEHEDNSLDNSEELVSQSVKIVPNPSKPKQHSLPSGKESSRVEKPSQRNSLSNSKSEASSSAKNSYVEKPPQRNSLPNSKSEASSSAKNSHVEKPPHRSSLPDKRESSAKESSRFEKPPNEPSVQHHKRKPSSSAKESSRVEKPPQKPSLIDSKRENKTMKPSPKSSYIIMDRRTMTWNENNEPVVVDSKVPIPIDVQEKGEERKKKSKAPLSNTSNIVRRKSEISSGGPPSRPSTSKEKENISSISSHSLRKSSSSNSTSDTEELLAFLENIVPHPDDIDSDSDCGQKRPIGPPENIKRDPVALYHYYKSLWDKQKRPGEHKHMKLRWNVRAQTVGTYPCINGQPIKYLRQ